MEKDIERERNEVLTVETVNRWRRQRINSLPPVNEKVESDVVVERIAYTGGLDMRKIQCVREVLVVRESVPTVGWIS